MLSQTLLRAIGNGGDGCNLRFELSQQTGKDDDALAEGESRVLTQQIPTVAKQYDDVELRDKTDERRENTAEPERPILLLAHVAVGSGELVDFFVFAGEALNHLHALRVLGQGANHGVGEFARLYRRRRTLFM